MKKNINIQYYEVTGKRKRAVARVRLYLNPKNKVINLKKDDNTTVKIQKGEILVNYKPIDEIFKKNYEKETILFPLKLTDNLDRFSISILVKGGGKRGQIEAIRYGLAKAIDLVDKESYHSILKENGLLTRDARKKERRKVGTGGKARREKQSPKR